MRNTAAATVQSDIFTPPQSGGPAEVTGCNGVSEGKTIWYDFYPDANGLVRIRTSAEFATVMAVMPFDPSRCCRKTPAQVRRQPASRRPGTVRRSQGREVLHGPDRRRRKRRRQLRVPVRLCRSAQASAGRNDAHRRTARRRRAHRQPRPSARPQRPVSRCAAHADAPPRQRRRGPSASRSSRGHAAQRLGPEDLRHRQERDRRLHRIQDRPR